MFIGLLRSFARGSPCQPERIQTTPNRHHHGLPPTLFATAFLEDCQTPPGGWFFNDLPVFRWCAEFCQPQLLFIKIYKDFFSRICNYWVETWNFWMSSSLGERTLQKNHSKQGSFGISPCLCLPQLLFGVVFQHRTMNHAPHKIGEVLTQPNRRFKQKLLEIGDGRYFRLFLMKLFWQVWNMRGTWRCFWSSSLGTFLMVSDGPCHYPKVQVSAAPHSQTLGTQQQDLVSQRLQLPLRHVFYHFCLNLWPCFAMCLTSSLAQGWLFLPFLCIFRPSSCLHPLRDMHGNTCCFTCIKTLFSWFTSDVQNKRRRLAHQISSSRVSYPRLFLLVTPRAESQETLP